MLLHAFGLREDQMRGFYSGKIKEEVSVSSDPCMVNIMIYYTLECDDKIFKVIASFGQYLLT